jgi:integrase
VKRNKRDAQRRLRELLSARDSGLSVAPHKLTVEQFTTQWLTDYARLHCSPKTVERYEEITRLYLVPLLGHHALEALRPLHIQEMRTQLQKKLSKRTCLHAYRLLFQMLRQAGRWQLLARNPAEATEAPKPQAREMRVLNAAQVSQLLNATKDTRLAMPITLAATTGMRRGEILGLKWDDVNLDAGTIRVVRSLEETRGGLRWKSPKSRHGQRTISLMATTIAALRHHRVEQAKLRLQLGPAYNPESLVCPGLNGQARRPSVFSDSFARLMKRLAAPGVSLPRVSFHGLRHSHATLALSANTNPKILSERLGHSNISITMDLYAHALQSMQDEAALAMEARRQAAGGHPTVS